MSGKFAFTEEAELTILTCKCPAMFGTLSGVSLFEVYTMSNTVTNWTGVKLDLGEGGEDLVYSYFSFNGDNFRVKTK